MKLCEKLHNYFENTGVQKKWLALRLGMEPHYFYHVLSGNRTIPQRYWKGIIELTNGKISMKDLLEECMREVDGVEIHVKDGATSCEVSLKELNNESQTVVPT